MSKQITRDHIEGLKKLVLTMVRGIVDTPDSVEVNIVPSQFRLIIELHTHEEDVGQVIGKSGHVVSAIRSIITAHGGREGLKVDMDYITEKSNGA
tara:strand:+ start:3203 stop:3487 length:285 start_codon:yes stop_codon:yes gene_type:complete